MFYDVSWLQKIIIFLILCVLWTLGAYFSGYNNGKKDQQLEYQREALQIIEQSSQTAIVIQDEMEKVDAQLEKASSVSDQCNYVLNFDLTPCGLFK